MNTYNQNKQCEVCQSAIPDSFVNLLCQSCYDKQVAEIEAKKAEMFIEASKSPATLTNLHNIEIHVPIQGILDPHYQTNPEVDDKDQILANLAQFIYSHDPAKGRKGKLLWYPQRNMYTFVKNYCMKKIQAHPQYPKYLWKPRIVDVGCGSGVGANILSQEADFVWGIDKNEFSIEFAKEAFTREKNQFYYSGQLTFDVIDIMKETRELMKFDIVTAIEIIEHIENAEGFLKALIIKFDKRVANPIHTEYFISTPNRAFHKLNKQKPNNEFHVREWTSQEFVLLLRKFFINVELMNQKGEPVSEDTNKDEVIFAKCSMPKI